MPTSCIPEILYIHIRQRCVVTRRLQIPQSSVYKVLASHPTVKPSYPLWISVQIILTDQQWYIFVAQQIIYASTNWCLWAEFRSVLKGGAVILKLDQVIPPALQSYKPGKQEVAFRLSQNSLKTQCRKGYQKFILYHTSLSTNSTEFTEVFKLKTYFFCL